MFCTCSARNYPQAGSEFSVFSSQFLYPEPAINGYLAMIHSFGFQVSGLRSCILYSLSAFSFGLSAVFA